MAEQYLIQTPDAVGEDVPIDLMSSFLAGITVNFALRYDSKAEPIKLVEAFKKVIAFDASQSYTRSQSTVLGRSYPRSEC